MAILQNIREKKVWKIVALVLVTGAMLLFIVGDIQWSAFGDSQTLVGEVNGDELELNEFQKRVAEMTSFYEIEMSQSSLDERTNEQIRATVWNQWVRERILAKECGKLGIAVSDEELAGRLSADNPHPMLRQMRLFYSPETGGFNPQALSALIGMINDPQVDASRRETFSNYWNFVQRAIRQQLLDEKYNTLAGLSFAVNEIDLQQAYDARRPYTVNYVARGYFTEPDSLYTVTASECKVRYNEGKHLYRQVQETREVEFLTFPIQPSPDDYEEVRQWISDLKEEFTNSVDFIGVANQNSDESYSDVPVSRASVDPDLADFAFSANLGDVYGPELNGRVYKMARLVEKGIQAPDSVQLDHILIVEASADRSMAVADSLVAVINGGGDFAALAAAYSKAGSGQNGGALGWLTEKALDQDMFGACVKAQTGRAFTYVLPNSPAVQVLRVSAKTAPVQKVKLCVLKREVDVSNRTYSRVYNEASLYISQNDDQESFEAAAVPDSGYYMRTFNVNKNDSRIAGIDNSRQVVRWAFENKAGTVSEQVFECGDQFVVACVKSVAEEGIQPFAAVQGQINAKIMNEKKAEKMTAEMASAASLSQLGEVKAAAGATFANSYVAGLGREPKVAGALGALSTDHITLVAGNSAVYALQLVSAGEQEGEFDFDSELNQYVARNPYGYLVYENLKNNAKIKDLRIRFF